MDPLAFLISTWYFLAVHFDVSVIWMLVRLKTCFDLNVSGVRMYDGCMLIGNVTFFRYLGHICFYK
jgi:hypothetical protein